MNTADIEAAEPGDVLRDDKVRGLQLRAFGQSKAFYLYYRTRNGRVRKPKVGTWPDLTLPKARTIARVMLDEVATGGDPSIKRQADRKAATVADMCDRYMREHGNHKKSKRDDERLIRLYVRRLAREPVADVTYTDVADWHAGIKAKVQANRALALMSTMLNMAERWDWRPIGSNPCRHVRRHKEQRRRRYMTADEAVRVFAAIEAKARPQPHAVAFIKLLIYTGARKSEIAAARWSDIDGDVLRLPDSKNGRARAIHLPQPALDALATLPRTSGTICMIADPYKTWYAVRDEAGCPDLRLHDLRHSFASAGLSAGLDLAAIGELLGHASAQTTKGYAHLMEDAGRAAATRTAELIDARAGRTLPPPE